MMEACSVPSFSSTWELTAFGECVAIEGATCIRDFAVTSRQVDGLVFFAVGIACTAEGDVAEELVGGPVAAELHSVFGGVETQLGGSLGDVVFVSTYVCGEAVRRAAVDGDEPMAVIAPAREPVAVVCVLCSAGNLVGLLPVGDSAVYVGRESIAVGGLGRYAVGPPRIASIPWYRHVQSWKLLAAHEMWFVRIVDHAESAGGAIGILVDTAVAEYQVFIGVVLPADELRGDHGCESQGGRLNEEHEGVHGGIL
jgi:hypothetical protein